MTDTLSSVLGFAPAGECEALAPCLVGPTGSGKTSRVRAWAAERGLPVLPLLLGTMLPEDVLGLPRVIKGRTVWSAPEWATAATERPVVLFLDELDKARPECHAAVLTLIAERRLRGVPLHPETRIVAAMQPVDPAAWLADETGRAMSARLVFLPVTYDLAGLGRRLGIDLERVPAPSDRAARVGLPVLPDPSDRQISWAVQWVRHCAARGVPEKTRDAALCGVMPEAWAQWILQSVTAASTIAPADILSALKDDPSLLDKLALPELIELSADIIHHLPADYWARAVVRVWLEGGPDEAEAWLRTSYEELRRRCEAAGGEIEVCAGAPEEEVARALQSAVDKVADEWRRAQ